MSNLNPTNPPNCSYSHGCAAWVCRTRMQMLTGGPWCGAGGRRPDRHTPLAADSRRPRLNSKRVQVHGPGPGQSLPLPDPQSSNSVFFKLCASRAPMNSPFWNRSDRASTRRCAAAHMYLHPLDDTKSEQDTDLVGCPHHQQCEAHPAGHDGMGPALRARSRQRTATSIHLVTSVICNPAHGRQIGNTQLGSRDVERCEDPGIRGDMASRHAPSNSALILSIEPLKTDIL